VSSGALANRLAALSTAVFDKISDTLDDLSPSAAAALLTLDNHGPLTATELAKIIGLSQPACVRMLDKLGRRNVVVRKAKIGRDITFALSQSGKSLAAELQRRRLSLIGRLLDQISDDDQRVIARLADHALGALGGSRSEARHLCRFCDHRTCEQTGCPVSSGVDPA
jgi:DNA-binding MarR family transcriptional regulator